MTNKGFTLVELIVVILLIGILSIFIAPRFFNDNDFKARGIADEIIMATRHAQRLSMSRGQNHRIIINPGSYRVEKFVTSVSTSVRHPDGNSSFNIILPANIVSTTTTIEFDQLGRPIPNITTNITIGTFSVTIEKETGYAHL